MIQDPFRISGPLSVRFWTGYIFSSYDTWNIFRTSWYLEHLGEWKGNKSLQYNQSLNCTSYRAISIYPNLRVLQASLYEKASTAGYRINIRSFF